MTDIENQFENTPEGEATPSEETPTAPTLPEYNMADLPEALRANFEKMGWNSMMQVQARAIPYIMANRDVMIQSRTGSGKTAAYLVPILQRIDATRNTTQALVLTPTRELAAQVVHEAEALSRGLGIRPVAVYGGVGYGAQLDAFRQGAHLVIGTPGRILDHLLRHSLDLEDLKILVFDEADRMLSMGFYPDMKRVQYYLPRRAVNTYMFSATIPPHVLSLSNEFMRQPDFLNLSSDHVHVTDTDHVFYTVPPMDKERSMIRIIEIENPASAIVFCNTKDRVHFVATILQRYGYNAAEISSDLSQAAREEVMEGIRQGQIRFLVATDVASRGIDIPDLSHVFQYEVPDDMESYIHRAGRTGRAGASGQAISLVNSLEKIELRRIGKRFQIDFEERPLPTDEDVQDIVAQRTMALLEARLRDRDRLKTERMQRFIPYLTNPENAEEALVSVAMLLDDFYHEHFHTAQLIQPDGKPIKDWAAVGSARSGGSEGSQPPRHKQGERRAAGHSSSPSREANRPTAADRTPAADSGAAAAPRRPRRRGGSSRGPGSQDSSANQP